MDTGLYDKNGTPINIGDRTRLVLDDGEIREFDVCFKTVKRTTIKTLRGFSPETADVSITGIFFCWEGNNLLPCVDENGVSDVSKMEVVKRMSGPEEEKYTIKQIIDAITQAGDGILYALMHKDREI